MDIRFLENGTAGVVSGLCDEYRLDRIASFADIVALYRRIPDDHPGCRPLFTLDDVGQAQYTSGHAVGQHDLARIGDLDISHLPPECFEDGEYLGSLNTKAEFAICANNYAKLAQASSFDAACAHGVTLDAEGLEEWIGFQDDPLSLFDQPASAMVVPVERSWDALFAFPNGYFTCDLGPAETHAVARHVCERHGYELLGIGASYLGFLRPTPASTDQVQAIAADLCRLYSVPDRERPATAAAFERAIAGRDHLWIRYID
jgi:hypothetical protein